MVLYVRLRYIKIRNHFLATHFHYVSLVVKCIEQVRVPNIMMWPQSWLSRTQDTTITPLGSCPVLLLFVHLDTWSLVIIPARPSPGSVH